MQFFLGTHRPHWLEDLEVPLCVSRRALEDRAGVPRARAPWMLDSGGFTELDKRRGWTVPASRYATLVRRLADEVGNLALAAPQDWMCEPAMVTRTGLSVAEHQRRTVDNFCQLAALEPGLPWMPVLQGWTLGDYHRCLELYDAAGVDLQAAPRVGLGSVCRRQDSAEIAALVASLSGAGVRHLHGFGVKLTGLSRYAWLLASADSFAWSLDGRMPKGGRCGSPEHRSCANCQAYALAWRERVLTRLGLWGEHGYAGGR